jgi:hypothetical protein
LRKQQQSLTGAAKAAETQGQRDTMQQGLDRDGLF